MYFFLFSWPFLFLALFASFLFSGFRFADPKITGTGGKCTGRARATRGMWRGTYSRSGRRIRRGRRDETWGNATGDRCEWSGTNYSWRVNFWPFFSVSTCEWYGAVSCAVRTCYVCHLSAVGGIQVEATMHSSDVSVSCDETFGNQHSQVYNAISVQTD